MWQSLSVSTTCFLYLFSIDRLTKAKSSITTTGHSNKVCQPWCNGKSCYWKKCSGCEFSCQGQCYYNYKLDCVPWCSPKDCNKKLCKGCIFCSDEPSLTCTLATFEDVTATILPKTVKYWYKYKKIN